MESLPLPVPEQAPNLAVSSGYCHTALALGRPISPVDHCATICLQNDGDKAYQTVSPFPSLSARDIKLPDNHWPAPDTLPPNTAAQIRALMGGKGMFLHVMQQANIPVPPFTVVESTLVATLEQHLFPSEYLFRFVPDRHRLPETSCSLEQLHRIVAELPTRQQPEWLNGLSEWITSEDFYQQVQGSNTASEIRDRYLTLRQQSDGACIIRSSGVDEDRFGDAQAGRYDSRVHAGGDILKTCLHVLSSAYRPKVCPDGRVKPIALIMQQCIHCQLGGAVISHSSLHDDTIQVEYAPGQPRGAVSGETGIQPHRYAIERNSAMGNEPDHHFTPGVITTQFVLKKSTTKEGYIEQSTRATADAKDILLADETLKQLRLYTEQLENIAGCPVDIEFGLDDRQQLYLFQVRPVTRLPGGTRFSTAAPSLFMAKGVMVSEGCCSGPAIAVTEPINAGQLPAGTIVFADHASDWMLAPDILQQAGGFVFRQGGTNDHVAITLRQAGIPCLLAGPQYSGALTNALGQQATLVAGSFAGNPGAYLLKGDQSAHWKAASTTSCEKIIRSTPMEPTAPPDFTRVDKGFDWLNRQNNKLLDYFHSDRLLSHCLGPGRSKEISMSAERSTLLSQLGREIFLLQQDLQQFVFGYRHFLTLAMTQQDAEDSEVRRLINELPNLDAQWERLVDSIDALCTQVVMPLAENQELPVQPVNYRQWLMDCQTLQDALQKLTQPKKVQDIRSAHDLIYWLHQRFVSALAPVAEASGQGQITEISKDRILVNVLSQGAFGLLNDDCIGALAKLNLVSLRMLNMADAAFINAELGVHVCTITMLEQAEGGKGRTLRLDISDNFSNRARNRHLQGKYKRFWFLVQALRCASVDENSRPMTICFNQSAGKMIIEYTQVNSTLALQAAFVKLVTILSGLTSLDTSINKFNRGKNADKWNFEKLAAKCQNGLDDLRDKWTFKHCLFLDTIYYRIMPPQWQKDYTFLDYLDKEYKLFLDITKRAVVLFGTAKDPEDISEVRQVFTDATKHLPPDDAARIIEELLVHYVIEFVSYSSFIQLLSEYSHLDYDRDLILFLVHQNRRLFRYVTKRFQDDIEIAKTATEQDGLSLQYASDRLKNDKSLVMLAVNNDGCALQYAGTDLKNDPDVVLLAARNYVYSFRHAGPIAKNNEALLRKIIEENPSAMSFATESLKDDKDFVLSLLSRGDQIYNELSDRLKSDPRIQMIARDIDAKFMQ